MSAAPLGVVSFALSRLPTKERNLIRNPHENARETQEAPSQSINSNDRFLKTRVLRKTGLIFYNSTAF